MKLEKQHACQGGTIGYYSHESQQTGTPMRFSLFLPPQAKQGDVPYVVFLSGLTCTEDNFTTKACAYKKAAELGLAVLATDTSPRGDDVADSEDYDLGQGAGFYINATEQPWAKHFKMESYLIEELIPAVEKEFPLNAAQKSITGHSMGGHGALTLYFKYPKMFKSCSAFSPIVAPTQVPWGHKAFTAYLGNNQTEWTKHDACALVNKAGDAADNAEILIDQGLDDQFLEEQLKPELFEEACKAAGQALTVRKHEGYDHSYFFIQSFIDDHLQWHSDALN
ncbi:MAG: S-formylglutathione hydrolase [Alphaproteobacteria bacterium]|nr:S-formylglutathione hydrolase [Alphaproteobacteria bacterium]